MFPILSAVSLSFATVIDKFVLKKNAITSRHFTAILFLYMGICCLPLLVFFRINTIDLVSISILILIIFGSALQNYLFYVTLNKKDLSSLEPISNAEPILIMLLAFLLFPEERNGLVLLFGLFTTIALVIAHYNFENASNRIRCDRYTLILLASMLLSAILFIVYKYALIYVSPVTLYVIRTIGVAVFLLTVFRPNMSRLSPSSHLLVMLAALLYSVAAVTQYFAIATVGVSITVLVLTLSSVITYLSSHFFLKEKVSIQQIIASMIIIVCVTMATVMG